MKIRCKLAPFALFCYWSNVVWSSFVLFLMMLFVPDMKPLRDTPIMVWVILLAPQLVTSIYVFFAVNEVVVYEKVIELISIRRRVEIDIADVISIDSCLEYFYNMSPYLMYPLVIRHKNGNAYILYRLENIRELLDTAKALNKDIKVRLSVSIKPFSNE